MLVDVCGVMVVRACDVWCGCAVGFGVLILMVCSFYMCLAGCFTVCGY